MFKIRCFHQAKIRSKLLENMNCFGIFHNFHWLLLLLGRFALCRLRRRSFSLQTVRRLKAFWLKFNLISMFGVFEKEKQQWWMSHYILFDRKRFLFIYSLWRNPFDSFFGLSFMKSSLFNPLYVVSINVDRICLINHLLILLNKCPLKNKRTHKSRDKDFHSTYLDQQCHWSDVGGVSADANVLMLILIQNRESFEFSNHQEIWSSTSDYLQQQQKQFVFFLF